MSSGERRASTPTTSSDPWQALRAWTPARIALGRAGASLPTAAWLDFRRAHAEARDAVHSRLDADRLGRELAALGLDARRVNSQAPDLASYLRRPDLGRRLGGSSRATLEAAARPEGVDLAIALADGLSAQAVHAQATGVLEPLLAELRHADWRLAPVAIVCRGRVAIQDDIGAALRARLALILIGERPGLISADSMSAYLVHSPEPGRRDAQRNCVSNIRAEGLAPTEAAATIFGLLDAARRAGVSGVGLRLAPGGGARLESR